MATAPSALPETDAESIFVGYPWEGVARLLDRAPRVEDLRAHRLQLLGAARLRERGLAVASELRDDARMAHLSHLGAHAILHRIRDLCAGPVLVLKGPEIAASYPAPALRPFVDVDLLVPDAEAVYRTLLDAGFRSIGPDLDWSSLHHLSQLSAPDLPVVIEVHRRPRWIDGMPAPGVDELFEHAVPSATGIPGLLAPAPEMHAVLLLANAWSGRPLERIGDLVDLTVVAGGPRRAKTAELASRFGLGRAWSASIEASDALFLGRPATRALRTWARNLPEARARTVLGSHLVRLLGPFAGLPIRPAARNAARALAATLGPQEGETWADKLARMRIAFRNAFRARTEHERSLHKGDRS